VESEKMEITDEELGMSLRLHARDCRREAGNVFFNSFEYAEDLQNKRYSDCLIKGLSLLTKCKQIDPMAYSQIHKGSAFYWIGMSAFLLNDYQTAAFFFDAAVSEDLRAGCHPITRSTPSFKFLLVQGDLPEQAARDLVKIIQDRFKFVITDYIQRPGSSTNSPTLSLELIRSNFLLPSLQKGDEHLRSLATALISFLLEWYYLNVFLDLRIEQGTVEPFIIHLFKGCVIFESLLRLNPKDPPPSTAHSLLPVLQHLRRYLNIPNNMPISAPNLSQVFKDLAGASNSIEDCIVYTGRVRNTISHNLGWQVWFRNTDYNKIVMMIICSCLHAIACLY
jgi:hypothetical protein